VVGDLLFFVDKYEIKSQSLLLAKQDFGKQWRTLQIILD